MLGNSVVHLHPFPQMTAFGYELKVNRVNLVAVLSGFVGEDECKRKIVAVVNHGPARIGRNANVSRCDVVNTFEGFQTSAKRVAVSLIFGVLEPEKYCVNEHGIR